MGLLRSLVLMLLLIWLPGLRAQPPNSARALDALLQDYAFRALVRPRTGTPYDGAVPLDLSGIKVAALRLRSGSLRRKGFDMYKEFGIPSGIIEQPYVERLVFVYQNLGNWTERYYPLPNYTYLTPILGFLAYNASNLSATNIPELDIRTSGDPISIEFSDVKSAPDGSIAKCVWFDLQGSPNFSNVRSGNECSTIEQGHFSIVVESVAPSPGPTATATPSGQKKKKKKNDSKMWIIVGSVIGGIVLLGVLSCLVVWVQKLKQRKKLQNMEKAADVGEALQMTSVGETKAPAAMVTRTQPTLENEYVP
ncbi:uncharacterized protein [Euphorbia lathyris]|uniref:uncharacterized protein n=1 Tax=Euphorbia lathyris TaxID=212925 RepID=UPI003313C3F6